MHKDDLPQEGDSGFELIGKIFMLGCALLLLWQFGGTVASWFGITL